MAKSFLSLYQNSKDILNDYYKAGYTLKEVLNDAHLSQEGQIAKQRQAVKELEISVANKKTQFIKDFEISMAALEEKLAEIENVKVNFNSEFWGKMNLLLNIWKSKNAKDIMALYADAIALRKNDLIYFCEDVLRPALPKSLEIVEFFGAVGRNKKGRLANYPEVQDELKKLQSIRRFYEECTHDRPENFAALFALHTALKAHVPDYNIEIDRGWKDVFSN